MLILLGVAGDHDHPDRKEAMKQNEMAVLGDYSIGTTYPLTLKLLAAMDQPRTISPEPRTQPAKAMRW